MLLSTMEPPVTDVRPVWPVKIAVESTSLFSTTAHGPIKDAVMRGQLRTLAFRAIIVQRDVLVLRGALIFNRSRMPGR
jgi:hypothetical protein